MTGKTKAPIVVLGILILFSLFLTGVVFNLLQKEKTRNLSLNEQIEEVTTKQRIAETKLQEAKENISALEAKLQDAQSQIDKLSQDLEQEKTAKLEASSQVDQLKTELEQQRSLRKDLESKIVQAQEETKKMQALLSDLESKKTELETKIKDLESQVQKAAQSQEGQGVELGTIVVSPEGTTAEQPTTTEEVAKKETPASALEGKILVVNKDYNFVVINLGSKDGVEVGNIFSVYHNNNYVGDVKVEKVHDSMSAADFVSIDIKDKVNEGDKVVQKIE